MKRLILFALSFALLSSCSVLKISKLFANGNRGSSDFVRTVPFERIDGLAIITVKVNGIEGKFLFDTGAPNVLSPEFAAKLNLATKAKAKINDSGGNKETQKIVVLDTVQIQGINFFNTAAVVVDLTRSDALACMELDGILGANVMRLAFWEIDYIGQTLTFTNNISNLSDTTGMMVLEFDEKRTGTPVVEMKVNSHKVSNITFDTGSTGHLTIPKKELKLVMQGNSSSEVISLIGSISDGVYGSAPADTNFYCLVDSLKLGELTLTHKVLEFSGKQRLLGTKLLENYTVIMDWKSEQIFLKQVNTYLYEEHESYGFGLDFIDQQLFVGSLFENTTAKEKLQIGDRILSINEDDFIVMDSHFFCDFVLERSIKEKYGERIIMKIQRGEDIFEVELFKKVLLR